MELQAKTTPEAPSLSKWSSKLGTWFKERLTYLDNRLNGIQNRMEISEDRLSNLENLASTLNDTISDLSGSISTLFDSSKVNHESIASLSDRVFRLDGLHDGDEKVLVFEQAGHQPVVRFYGEMEIKDVQSVVDKVGRPLYIAHCIEPTPTPSEEEE